MSRSRHRPVVAIIGAGIAGAAAAWELSRDHQVVLVEREPQAGLHATGRSAAILSETSGTRAVCALARASRGFLESPPDDFADAPLTSARGLLWIARPEDAAQLDAIEVVARSGVAPTARRLDPHEISTIHPALRDEAVSGGAFYEPDARSVDVATLLQSYLRGAKQRGATVHFDAPLRSARYTSSGSGTWELDVGHEVIRADAIVNAAGAWADAVAEMAGIETLGLVAFRRTACVVPTSEHDAAWPLVMDAGGRFYFEPEAGGLLVSPADETPSEPMDARPDEEDIARAIDALRDATTLPVRSMRRAWAGLRTFAADRVPVVGESCAVPRFFWLAGQGGAGIKTAPAMAAALASLVRGDAWPSELAELGVTATDLSPERFAARAVG